MIYERDNTVTPMMQWRSVNLAPWSPTSEY